MPDLSLSFSRVEQHFRNLFFAVLFEQVLHISQYSTDMKLPRIRERTLMIDD